ncbi:MAG: hypothetical protein Q8Q97_00910 [bacterium]|nr:hypothetical protein [bacterium]
MKEKFFSVVVEPINTVEESTLAGHHTARVKPAKGAKRVYVVPVPRGTVLLKDGYPAMLAEHKLKPCVDGPAYLLSLMAKVPEFEMPDELHNIDIVAAEPDNPTSVFQYDNDDWFLYFSWHESDRKPNLANVRGVWSSHWAFLAEDA